MPGLIENLTNASRSLTAQRLGIDVAGQNLANINTPGYTRRTLQLAEVPPGTPFGAGRGVEVVAIRALRDEFVESRLRRERYGLAFDEAVADGLAVVEASVGQAGAAIDARLTAFFSSFSFLANDVTSVAARDAVLQQGQALAQAFGDQAERLQAATRDADQAVRNAVAEINQLSAEVATLNRQIIIGDVDVESLRDRRDLALGKLAELAGVGVLTRADGAVDVTLGPGRPLVIGGDSYPVAATASPPAGLAALSVGGVDVTSTVTAGKVGGLLHVRDTLLPGYAARLDQLAYDVATAVNAAHASGYDATGAVAGNFFVPPATVAGAAATLAVDPAIVADTQRIAGSSTGAAGDNQTATAIGNLHESTVALGGTATPAGAWAQLVYALGSDIAGARASATGREEIVRQLDRLRDQASGVSIDEEAANLIKFQRAYEANARYFTTIVDTLDTLMNLVR